ncbi:unnamed protein product [Phytophthora fragariaefolia]|uniref:Unnamed protein product n=1 Tax=Phytophthora fragariaefolia TaxID=1490495 RepID=A0A9W6XXU6_9STRA|nr:unnamed protein product [Phytophthora fragariaefolia]
MGVMACKKETLQLELACHEKLTDQLSSVRYLHVLRHYNAAVDSLATEALDSKMGRVNTDLHYKEANSSNSRAEGLQFESPRASIRVRRVEDQAEVEVSEDRIPDATDIDPALDSLIHRRAQNASKIADSFDLSEDGLLYYQGQRRRCAEPGSADISLRLVVPTTMVDEVLHSCHNSIEGGHQGINAKSSKKKTDESVNVWLYALNGSRGCKRLFGGCRLSTQTWKLCTSEESCRRISVAVREVTPIPSNRLLIERCSRELHRFQPRGGMVSVASMPMNAGDEPVAEVISIRSDIAKRDVDYKELQGLVKQAGRAFVDVLGSAAVSPGCRLALERMATSGEAIELRFVEEIHSSQVLVNCTKANGITPDLAAARVAELREAMATCAMGTLASAPSVELLSLWSVVHDSVSDVITEETTALAAQATATASEVMEALDDVSDNAKAIGKLLTTALASLVTAVSPELRQSVQQLADFGSPLAVHLTDELHRQLGAIRAVLPPAEWVELRSRCSQSTTAEWRSLGETARAISAQATEDMNTVKLAASEVFDSPVAKTILSKGFTGLNGTLGHSRDAVEEALDAVRDGGAGGVFNAVDACLARSGFPPLLRVEIARDFFQTVELFFTGLDVTVLVHFEQHHAFSTPSHFLHGLRVAYDVMAINMLGLVEKTSQNRTLIDDIALSLLLVVVGIVYASYVWFVISGWHLHRRADEVRQGYEATTWTALAMKHKMRTKMFTFVITACLTVYLPLTRLCLDVAMVQATDQSISEDSNKTASVSGLALSRYRQDSSWTAIVVAAVVLLLTFTIPLPWLLVRAIVENRPTGSLENPLVTHDLDGEEVPFDDKVYARLVNRDPSQLRCPYRSLYAGLQQCWSYYKVLQLLVKLALALVLVLTAGRLRGILLCVIYAVVVAVSTYGTPFNDPLNNAMEISGKVAALTTCIGGAIAAFVDMQQTRSRTLEVVVGFVSVVHIVNLFAMLAVLLLGMRGARLFLKNSLGWITFSDTTRGLHDATAKNILPRWDIDKEIKHRVWQSFWRSLLLEIVQNSRVPKGNIEETTVVHRLESLEQAVVASGVHCVRSHWRGEENPYTSKIRRVLCAALEGVDIFWDDTSGTRDGKEGSKSCFGKMYVIPYPFHCVVVYDDSKDVSIVRDDTEVHEQSKIAKLLFLNFTPIIIAKRSLRQKLRVLSSQQTSIHFPFSRPEKVTVEDGTITWTDRRGKHKMTRRTTVPFTCHYTRGIIRVTTRGDVRARQMAEGFEVSMTYRDGHGEATAPHTGKVYPIHGRVAVMGHDHIGLTPAMMESDQLQTIFRRTREIWEPGVLELHKEHQAYRQSLERKHFVANSTLSDAFWYFVYNNPNIGRPELEDHFNHRELNPKLKSLAVTHQSAFDSLYLRMDFTQSHPAVAFWFVFWDDVLTPSAPPMDNSSPDYHVSVSTCADRRVSSLDQHNLEHSNYLSQPNGPVDLPHPAIDQHIAQQGHAPQSRSFQPQQIGTVTQPNLGQQASAPFQPAPMLYGGYVPVQPNSFDTAMTFESMMPDGLPPTPSSVVELRVRCKGLESLDYFSKSDPFIVLYMQDQYRQRWMEIGRTETLKNAHDPTFLKSFQVDFFFEEVQQLRLEVFDRDSSSERLSDHDFLGCVEITMGQLMAAKGQSVALKLLRPLQNDKSRGYVNPSGHVIIDAEEVSLCADMMTVKFAGTKLDNTDGWFGASDPFLNIFRLRDENADPLVPTSWSLVWRTEVIMNNCDPKWQQATMSMQTLCNGNLSRLLKFECMDWQKNGKHQFIGSCTIKAAEFVTGEIRKMELINPVKQKKKGKKYTNSGVLVLEQIEIFKCHTFVEYLRGGCEISLIVGIDYTASNGNPSDPSSLHYIGASHQGQMNDYQAAITATGVILEPYDSVKRFPVYGFGGRINGMVNHCFSLTFDPYQPEVEGTNGILTAYANSFQRVQLHGPTFFAPLIRQAATIAKKFSVPSEQGGGNNLRYFVLLIITDGVIMDMQQTIDELVQASTLPLSIIIVAVGNSDFTAMSALDSDGKLLVDSRRNYTDEMFVQSKILKISCYKYLALARFRPDPERPVCDALADKAFTNPKGGGTTASFGTNGVNTMGICLEPIDTMMQYIASLDIFTKTGGVDGTNVSLSDLFTSGKSVRGTRLIDYAALSAGLLMMAVGTIDGVLTAMDSKYTGNSAFNGTDDDSFVENGFLVSLDSSKSYTKSILMYTPMVDARTRIVPPPEATASSASSSGSTTTTTTTTNTTTQMLSRDSVLYGDYTVLGGSHP